MARTSSWIERWLGLRNALIANPRFQRWAAASPLTRLIARRRARALFDLCAGFVYSQVLLACVRLRVLEILSEGPRAPDGLAAPLGLSSDAARRLLRAATALGLTRALPGDRFGLDELGAALLGNPSVMALVEHHALLYDDLRDPVALLRGESSSGLSRFWPYAGDYPGAGADRSAAPDDAFAAYSGLMSQSQALVAEDILDAYPIARRRRLLDVGGGEGLFVAAAAARAPGLELTLFDLPPVIARARARLAARGLGERVATVGGSFLVDPLPEGADVVSLVRIVHDHDDESALTLLRAVHAALPSGGQVIIAEPMAGTPGAEPMGDAYFGFYLLAMGRGRPRTPEELKGLLLEAGFARARLRATARPLLASLMVADRV
ncbi:MAG: methyltransferase [Roseiarcus sp.]